MALNHWYSASMTITRTPEAVNARTLLLPYALALIAAMIGVQVCIAIEGGAITLFAGVLTAVIAVGIVVWLVVQRRALARIRFGGVIAHTVAYVTVTTSFTAHAVLRTIAVAGSEGRDAASALLLGSPWFGATLVMSAAWGIGLLVHLLGAIAGRGWEV